MRRGGGRSFTFDSSAVTSEGAGRKRRGGRRHFCVWVAEKTQFNPISCFLLKGSLKTCCGKVPDKLSNTNLKSLNALPNILCRMEEEGRVKEVVWVAKGGIVCSPLPPLLRRRRQSILQRRRRRRRRRRKSAAFPWRLFLPPPSFNEKIGGD